MSAFPMEQQNQSLEQQIDPLVYSNINEQAWHQALLMVFSEVPTPDNYEEGCSSYDNPCDEFMDAAGEWPEGFTPWCAFEHWQLEAVQETVEEFRDSLMYFAQKTLSCAGVIDNE